MGILRRLLQVLLIVVTLIIGATAAAIIVSQTAWFKNWLRGYIVREANQYLNGTLSIQRLSGNLFFGIEMENVGVSMDGSEVVGVKDLGLNYNAFELLVKGMSVDSIRIDKPVIYLRRDGDTWAITKLVKRQQQEANRSGPVTPITIDDIGISDGSVVVDAPVGTSGVEVPKRIDRLDAKLSFKYEPVHYSIEISHVSFRGSDPALAVNALSGGIALKDDALFVDKLALRTAESSVSVDGAVQRYLTEPSFNLRISSDKMSLPEIARIVPALRGIALQPQFAVNVSGPLDRLGVNMRVQSSAGAVDGRLVADVMAPGQSLKGTVSVRHLNLAPLVKNPAQKSDITAEVKADLAGPAFSDLNALHGVVEVNAPRIAAAGYAADRVKAVAKIDGRKVGLTASASAYGVAATADGIVTLPEMRNGSAAGATSFDLRGQVRKLDLARLPRELKAPSTPTNVNADYHVSGAIPPGQNGTPNVDGDLRFLASKTPGVDIAPGSRVGFSMHAGTIGYDADATVGHVDLERVGHAFNVPALAADRYKTDINAHVTVKGEGTDPKSMHLVTNGAITDSSLMGGRIPQLAFDATLADDAAHVKANGAFGGFDPAIATGKPSLKGTVGGKLDVDVTARNLSSGVAADAIQGSARIALDASTIAGLQIDRAALDADYHNSTGDIRQAEVVGRDLNVTASGTLALNETDQSNLRLHADTPSLAEVGRLIGQPLAGIAKLDATVSGNRTNLQATGNLTADGIKYGANGALTLSTDYTLAIPDLAADRAKVTADTHATFVSIGGQNINELDAKTTYAEKQVTFDATARQPQRSLAAGGTVLLHPDHQEVHLQRLDLQAQSQRWRNAPGASTAIQYGGNAITVKDLRLLNGEQQIAADGTFGSPNGRLVVTLKNVDLAGVNALLLRPPQVTGRLNASVTLSGDTKAPKADATFQIDQGGFRQFHYQAFTGTAAYTADGVTVDSRLQQNATTWLTAKGYLPMALFNGKVAAGEAAQTPANRIDFHVDSSPIDLGLVQGATTALTNVKGVLQAKVDVTGTADDPKPNGAITIQNAAFTVDPTGVDYTDLDGRIDLSADRVHIDEIRVLDNQKKPMSITGDLAIHEKQVGGVSIAIKADDFKVIDNKMGNVRINSDLQIAGELQYPRVEGDLGISTGAIDIDPILASAGGSAYATTETQYGGENAAPGQQPAAPSPFDALQLNVRLTVPNDLVIKGQDLKTPGSPIGLGAINLTLGGDVLVSKQPWDIVRLYGNVNTVRGFYDFQGRRFTILRDGSVRFEGLDELDPALDIRAQRLIQSVQANVNVRGHLHKPEIVLSSVPPLEQGDILALIVFNQPLNQLGEGQQVSLVQRAQAMAEGAVTGQIAKSIGNALNLDEFEINLAPETGGGPEVTIGEQVGQNLYLKIEQGISDQSMTNVILEYELTSWLRFRTNVMQGSSTQQSLFQRAQGTGADLLFFFSY